jgi:hypothetical protein
VKKLVISLLVVVMALGTMGAAFATNLNFPGEPDAIMAQGFHTIPDVNCTGIVFGNGVDTTTGCMGWYWYSGRRIYADSVWVRFDRNLRQYTRIEVVVTDTSNPGYKGWHVMGEGNLQLGGDLPAETWIEVGLNRNIYFNTDLNAADYVNVRVIGGTGTDGG